MVDRLVGRGLRPLVFGDVSACDGEPSHGDLDLDVGGGLALGDHATGEQGQHRGGGKGGAPAQQGTSGGGDLGHGLELREVSSSALELGLVGGDHPGVCCRCACRCEGVEVGGGLASAGLLVPSPGPGQGALCLEAHSQVFESCALAIDSG